MSEDIKMESYQEQIKEIIETLELNNETERNILKSRFLAEVLMYEKRKNNTKKYYNVFRFIVTLGSLFLPALLSIGQMDPAKLPRNFDNISYWASWTISLTVTACNGFLQLFSLDKNYFEFSITTEQLKTEGWQFFQLSGKYEEYESHKEAYKAFCKSIENIKRKQVEKEFPGKADVSKGKKEKKKEFDFQQELIQNLPSQYKKEVEVKNDIMDQKMDKLLGLLGNEQLTSAVGNVKDILASDASVEIQSSIEDKENKKLPEITSDNSNKESKSE
tara:strand:+ start:1288 stop:2112 length:825 start_codon:yes stop_codon:yes gene_type:complete